jgi:pimeloyl-ACP methyl ester carboxylesterase
VEFADVAWDGGHARIEYEWIGDARAEPVIVFLHEGLGSRSMWRGFPLRLCEAVEARGLVYSRPGFGRSSPREGAWDESFLHREAHQVLPAFLRAVGLEHGHPWLFGHSDGGSIALLHAARFPGVAAGIVVVAPHILVEDLTLRGIEAAVREYRTSDWHARLARHHDDPGGVFRGWSELWLQPRFKAWTIERELEAIRCPVLAVQGAGDEYGTLEQVRGIARRVPRTRVVELPGGHSPHREQPGPLIMETVRFIRSR